MVYADWKPWQVILFKCFLILSSMCYFSEGLMFIYGKDKLSDLVTEQNNKFKVAKYAQAFASIPH